MRKFSICVFIFMFLTSNLFSQITLYNLPPNTSNNRFGNVDLFPNNTFRPYLSIRGFDSQSLPNGNNFGLGLKQILYEYFNTGSGNGSINDVGVLLFGQGGTGGHANKSYVIVSGSLDQKMDSIEVNSRIIQAKAFVALSTLVLEQNGHSAASETKFGKNHSVAMAELKAALVNPPGGQLVATDLVVNPSWVDEVNAANILINIANGFDPVHSTKSLNNIARAIDLYLAIENAYAHYGINNSALLTQTERNALFARFGRNIRALHTMNQLELGDLNDIYHNQGLPWYVTTLTLELNLWVGLANEIADLQFNELQPGNWPFKIFLSTGYASLAMNGTSLANYSGFFNDAYRAAGIEEQSDRTKYWSYQTGNGQKYFAEGPHYLHFTLEEMIPFWHAVRGAKFWKNSNHSSGILQHNSVDVNDPFHNDWFTSPIEWMADIVTPDGKYPPLDDGNKRSMSRSSVLRWTSGYGNNEVGQKYAAINSQSGGFGSNANLQLVELAIPRNQTASSIAMYDITNNDGTDQQLVTRRNSPNGVHYVLLNGERGNAVTRGEGHEQPDQLQLLYYIGDTSYLMDSGYDSGDIFSNSTWNNYKYHNNLSHIEGGNPKPPFNGWGLSILNPDFAVRKIAHNHPVLSLQHETTGQLTRMSGMISVSYQTDWGSDPNTQQESRYDKFSHIHRTLLFVNDSTNPYLIDMNKAVGYFYYFPDAYDSGVFNDLSSEPYLSFTYRLKYHTGGNSHSFLASGNKLWSRFTFNNADPLYVYSNFVEYDNQNLVSGSLSVQEDQPATSRTLHLDHNGVRHLNTLSLIKATATQPSMPVPLFPFGSQNYQVWKWEQDQNTLDIVIKRGGASAGIITFDVSHNSASIAELKLAYDKDYGFARLILQNGTWTIHPDYKLNIDQDGYFYTTTQTIGSITYPANSKVYVGNNQTLTISGHAQFGPGTTVTLGSNASIVVSGSGRITADGTTFTSVDPTNPAVAFNRIELNSSGNSFTNSTFKGGNNQNVLVKQSGNTFTGCVFSHSKVGLSLFTVAAEAILIGSTITQNTQHGAYVDGGTLILKGFYKRDEFHVDPTMEFWGQERFNPASIHGNTGNGITLIGTGKLHTSQSRVMDNTGNQVSVGNDARMYAEEQNHNLDRGLNRISKTTTGYYIYSTARTVSGETYQNWTIPARFNFWGGGSEPSAGRFFGPVDASDKLLSDSTTAYIRDFCMVASCDVRGKSVSLATVLSSAMTTALANEASTAEESERRIVTKERILAIRNHISAYPDDPFNARLLREWHGLLQSEGASTWSDEKQMFAERLETRKTQHAADMVVARNSGRRAGSGRETNAPSDLFRPDSELDPKHLIGETAWILSLAGLAESGQFEQLLTQAGSFGSQIFNADNRASVQVYRMQALQSLGRYEEAISALNELERIQPSADMQANYIAQDYGPVRRYLAELAGIDVNATLAKSNATMDHTGTPHTFALHPSFPNPFNPTTTVRYLVGGSNGSSAQVRIAVFDLLGREVAVLVNERKQAGEYTHVFDASGVSSGIYLIHARLGSQVFSHKITLIK